MGDDKLPFSLAHSRKQLQMENFLAGKSYGTEVDWMDSTSEEVAFWEKMANSPNTWVEATLPLRMLLIAKISK